MLYLNGTNRQVEHGKRYKNYGKGIGEGRQQENCGVEIRRREGQGHMARGRNRSCSRSTRRRLGSSN